MDAGEEALEPFSQSFSALWFASCPDDITFEGESEWLKKWKGSFFKWSWNYEGNKAGCISVTENATVPDRFIRWSTDLLVSWRSQHNWFRVRFVNDVISVLECASVITCSILPRRVCELVVFVCFVLFFATVFCWFLFENLLQISHDLQLMTSFILRPRKRSPPQRRTWGCGLRGSQWAVWGGQWLWKGRSLRTS